MAVLGLDVRVERNGALRLRDPLTGEDLLSYDEEHDGRRAAEARARKEVAARRATEARAKQEAEARKAAEARAREEVAARETAEVKVAELQALLQELQGGRTSPGGGSSR